MTERSQYIAVPACLLPILLLLSTVLIAQEPTTTADAQKKASKRLAHAEQIMGHPNGNVSGRLFYTDYNTVVDPRTVKPIWQSKQEPHAPGLTGELQTDRIQVVPASATPAGPRKPAGPTLRVELRPFVSADGTPGDQQVSGNGYQSNRAEVYARHAVPGSTPAARWPDPVDSTRWYGISVFVPGDFQTDRKLWFVFTQWKGYHTGSPPLALEIKGDQFETGGIRVRHKLGSIAKGNWTNFVVGVHFSADAKNGWVNIYRDGVEVVKQTPQATMKNNKVKGTVVVDPNYLKQGIYRTKAWLVTHVLYFGPTTIGTSKESVAEYLR